MSKYIYSIILLCVVLIQACGKKSPVEEPGKPLPPGQAVLTFPEKNSACTTGDILSDEKSSIVFRWQASANADSYLIGITNLLTQTTHYKKTEGVQLKDTLLRNTPYAWFVISKSKALADTAKSELWKFYNAGPGTIVYAPFPAEIISPALNQTVNAIGGTVNLVWKGSSIEQTIKNYDLYFGTTNTPALFKTSITDMFAKDIAVTPGTTYYWKIITNDQTGNTSDSGLYTFKVN